MHQLHLSCFAAQGCERHCELPCSRDVLPLAAACIVRICHALLLMLVRRTNDCPAAVVCCLWLLHAPHAFVKLCYSEVCRRHCESPCGRELLPLAAAGTMCICHALLLRIVRGTGTLQRSLLPLAAASTACMCYCCAAQHAHTITCCKQHSCAQLVCCVASIPCCCALF